MYYWIPSLKHYTSYLAILFIGLLINSSNIIGAEEDAAPLSLEQLEEKLEKSRDSLDTCRQGIQYVADMMQPTNDPDDITRLVRIQLAFLAAVESIQETIKNLEEQIDTYDEQNPNTRSNNQNDNPLTNLNRRLHSQDANMSFPIKIVIGIIVLILTSLFTIVIWESFPKKKKKKTTKYPFSTLRKPQFT